MTSDSDGLILPVGPSSRTNCAHVSFPAGTPVGYDPGAWAQTLVMVQQGVLRLTCQSGRDADFPAGAIVYLAGLPLASIGAAGREPVLLLLLSRRPVQHPDHFDMIDDKAS
jgi:hypothetical protein